MSYAYDLRAEYADYDDDDMEMYERECLQQDWLMDEYDSSYEYDSSGILYLGDDEWLF